MSHNSRHYVKKLKKSDSIGTQKMKSFFSKPKPASSTASSSDQIPETESSCSVEPVESVSMEIPEDVDHTESEIVSVEMPEGDTLLEASIQHYVKTDYRDYVKTDYRDIYSLAHVNDIKMSKRGPPERLESHLSVDAEPWVTPVTFPDAGPSTDLYSHEVSVDAMPGRRYPVGRIRPPPPVQGQGDYRPPAYPPVGRIRPPPPVQGQGDYRPPVHPPAVEDPPPELRLANIEIHTSRPDVPENSISRPANTGVSTARSRNTETRPSFTLADEDHQPSENRQVFPPAKSPTQSLKQNEDSIKEKLQSLDLSDTNDSSYGSLSSSESAGLTLSPTPSLEEEIQSYKSKMPTDLKAPYIDVLVLYAEDDRGEAEKFREHLINDIILQDKSKVSAFLYDCDEFTGLSGSKFQHLELAVERSTYVFVYLTKQFVECKWCEISSESCLMKAIYDVEKRWCVVPVYTQRRNKCDFKIPMGLNSLKGINYYNKDEFYRNGVARLIGDKIEVKFRMEKGLKAKQKTWIEEYKRKLEKQKDYEMRIKHIEEEKTRNYTSHLEAERQRWMQQGYSYLPVSFSDTDLASPLPVHPSLSTHSLKDVPHQHPTVAQYFNDLKQQNLHHHPHGAPPPNLTAGYGHSQHGVKRSTSQMSSVSNDMASLPLEIFDKIKNLPQEDQRKYLSIYMQQVSEQHQREAVMNMPQQSHPSLQVMPPPIGTPQPPWQQEQQQLYWQIQQQQHMYQSYHGNQQSLQSPPSAIQNQNSAVDPLQSAPDLNMKSLNFPNHQDNSCHSNQAHVAAATQQPSQLPNFDEFSMNSYHPERQAESTESETYSSSSSHQSASTFTGSEGQGQSVDGPKSSYRGGNIPNSDLFASMSQPSTQELPRSNLEKDSPSPETSLKSNFEDKSLDGTAIKKTSVMEKTSKGEKHVHYTIYNIYEANTVQIGASNKVEVAPEEDSESEDEEDNQSDDDADGKKSEKIPVNDSPKSAQVVPKTSHGNPNCGQVPGEVMEQPLTAIPDGQPSTAPLMQQTNPYNFANSPPASKPSEGMKVVGMVSPIIRDSRDTSPDESDKDSTKLKTVAQTSQTFRKAVNSDENQTLNVTPTLVHPVIPRQDNRNVESIDSINRASSPRQQCSVGPIQSRRPTNPPNFYGSNFSNSANLYSRRWESVAPGDDPLQCEAGGRDLPGESNGFNPAGTNIDDDLDKEYDMVHDNYEGGDFTESIEKSSDSSKSNQGGRLNNFFSRLTRGVKS